jgi:hypothetical protein
MTNAPFPVSPHYTAMAIAYRPQGLIADRVLPRAQVLSMEFQYAIRTRKDAFTIPDMKVGRLGKPGISEFSATSASAVVEDYGRDFLVPNRDIELARGNQFNIDPVATAVKNITGLIELAREKRVADLVFAAATYPSGNKEDLNAGGGSAQWDDYTDGHPIQDIQLAADTMPVRPNKFVVGRQVLTKMRMHPKVIAAAFGNGGNASVGGMVPVNAIADLIEMEVIVGDGEYNTANIGQTQSNSRIWGKHAAMLYINPEATPTDGVTFGMTAQWGSRIAGQWPTRDVGLRGGVQGRVGESVLEKVLCSDCGYFFENAID